jgi:hypothetical protein
MPRDVCGPQKPSPALVTPGRDGKQYIPGGM